MTQSIQISPEHEGQAIAPKINGGKVLSKKPKHFPPNVLLETYQFAHRSAAKHDSEFSSKLKIDKRKNPTTLVDDLVSNVNVLEKVVALLEEALVRARNPEETVGSCIKFVQDGCAEILNPNLVLESELDALVQSERPPNGKYYALRSDKSETAVQFFYRVYKRFYGAGVIYKPHLRAMDLDLYTALANSKALDKPQLKSITELNEQTIRKVALSKNTLAKLTSASYRHQIAA